MKFGLVLAGGLGKRMESTIPKVLHEINNKPMICYVIDTAFKVGCESIGIIVGKYKSIILETIEKLIKLAEDLEKEDSYKNLSLAELEDLLQKAVSDENYEVAAKIRDEISKR